MIVKPEKMIQFEAWVTQFAWGRNLSFEVKDDGRDEALGELPLYVEDATRLSFKTWVSGQLKKQDTLDEWYPDIGRK